MVQFLLVSYDISDNHQRPKIMKTLEGFLSRVQYSVFECRLKLAEITDLCRKIRKLAKHIDSIRIYPIIQDDIGGIEVIGNGQVTPHSIFYLL